MNSYLIATKHPLAAESQAAVLERHHAQPVARVGKLT